MSGAVESPGSAVLVAELSLSFRDELAASIQSALGVAVELAVAEVTKLVSQAMRDVRDQMHETLRDNKRLESRLLAAESELRSVHGRLAEAQRQAKAMMRVVDPGCPSGLDAQERDDSPATDVQDLSPERIAECLADLDRSYGARATREAEEGKRDGYEGASSFCEIREDGSVCTQGLNPDLTDQDSAGKQRVEATKCEPPDIEDYHSSQGSPSHFNQACVAPVEEPGGSADLIEGSGLHEPCMSAPQVAVKLEKPEQCGDPECAPLSEQDEFGSDCLSLAQSRLLDDWRPELQLQNCQADLYTSSGSNALADPSIFPGEIPDLDFLTSPAASQPDPFPSPLRREAPSISNQVPNQLFPAHTSGPIQHLCKVCGQSFLRQVDLRKHRTIMHPKTSGGLHRKAPKHNLFPPGRSPYHCSQCGRDFNRMEHLKIHQRIHTGERPYVCTACSACFRHSWALTRHFRIHTGEMPYQCGQCGKTFRNCGGLKFHQRSHARGQVA